MLECAYAVSNKPTCYVRKNEQGREEVECGGCIYVCMAPSMEIVERGTRRKVSWWWNAEPRKEKKDDDQYWAGKQDRSPSPKKPSIFLNWTHLLPIGPAKSTHYIPPEVLLDPTNRWCLTLPFLPSSHPAIIPHFPLTVSHFTLFYILIFMTFLSFMQYRMVYCRHATTLSTRWQLVDMEVCMMRFTHVEPTY